MNRKPAVSKAQPGDEERSAQDSEATSVRSRATTKVRRLPTNARGEETFQRILDAASAKLAAGESALEISTASIAKACGISLSSLYWFFPDIIAIFDAILARHNKTFAALQTEALLLNPPRTAEELVQIGVSQFVQYVDRNKDFMSLLYGGGYHRWLIDTSSDTPAEITKTYLIKKFNVKAGTQFDLRFRLWMEACDRIIGFAFRRPPSERPAIYSELYRMGVQFLLND